MKIIRMKATFGGLDHRELELKEGLNIIEAPNEGGKSTWSAFLRAMFYGINTKERDKQGYIAEKNRYQPWNGGAMEGVVELEWKGEGITLRRGPKGNTPFGKFEAVYTDTGEPVGFLTAENVGETLIGAPREVFERSAFVGQGGAAIDGAPALEARIAALASSGEEDVSYSQVERRLRDWLNRRKHNKTGLIPKLEEELAQGSALLERLVRLKPHTVYLEQAGRDVASALSGEGWACWSPQLDQTGDTRSAATRSSALMNTFDSRTGSVRVMMDDRPGTADVLARLLPRMEGEDYRTRLALETWL